MIYLVVVLIGYIFGSFPTAYLIVKKKHKINILNEGSGNVGAFNSIKVTSSKGIGIVVLLIDAGKGLLAVLLVGMIIPESFTASAIALIFAVLAHCFNPWLGFKGGRGLATAAGGTLMIAPLVLILWLLLWAIAYVFRKNVHFGNISATILSIALAWSSGDIINKYTFPHSDNPIIFQLMTTIMMSIILIKHWEPIKNWFSKTNEFKRNKDEKL